MRIDCISIKNLFSRFNYKLNFSNSKMSIIHGENGSGKTSILRIIDSIFNLKLYELINIEFSECTLFFDNGDRLLILKPEEINLFSEKIVSSDDNSLKIYFNNENPLIIKYATILKEQEIPVRYIERLIPDLIRIGPRRWQYIPTRETLRTEDVIRRFGDELPQLGQTILSDDPDWYKQLRKAIPVKFIDTKRLFSQIKENEDIRASDNYSIKPSINDYSQELKTIMQSYNYRYAAISQKLDRNVWRRILDLSNTLKSKEDIYIDLIEIRDKYNKLIEAGIFSDSQNFDYLKKIPDDIELFKLSAVDMYNQESLEKLSVFDDLLEKLNLFRRILESKIKYCNLVINKEEGIKIYSKKSKKLIRPNSLSSGEQHEFILLFELLFKTENDSLILIDEPEISLHVNWQEDFIDDLLQISKLVLINSLIATHSPFIVNDKHDLLINLKNLDD